MTDVGAPPPETLRDFISYDKNTGKFHWTRPARYGARPGDVAGSMRKDGYWRIGFRGRQYLASRLAWWLVMGDWPSRYIDHANGIPLDNRFSNLRPATQSQNMANRRGSRPAGMKGVIPRPSGRFCSVVTCNGKPHYLGTFDTAEEAHAAYAAKAAILHGNFARTA
jgi:hypothetical protein